MEKGTRKLTAAFFAAASLLTATALPLQAANYAESGDAGQTLGAAANTTGTGAAGAGLTSITGLISSITDADLYSFTLTGSSAVRFQVTTVSNGIDSVIYLFGPGGTALLANDDASGFTLNPSVTLPAGLAAGTYYLGIALSSNEPINTNTQMLFAATGDSTSVRGPATGVNPATLGSFNSGALVTESGTYNIAITNVPEPSTWAALALGAVATATLARRKRASVA